MHKELLVAAVKLHGQILREHTDTVYLPFGSEYSIFVKNLSTERCEFRIKIDGKNICDNDQSFVINGNSSVEIERFVSSMDKGYRFKFIERTAEIEEFRGISAEDGLIQIDFEFERKYQPLTQNWTPAIARERWVNTNDLYINTRGITCSVNNITAQADGITTLGSFSDQQFNTTIGIIGTGIKHSLIFKLKGQSETSKVSTPLTVKTKTKCPTCGKSNNSKMKFCPNCGTNLQCL